MKLTVNDDLIDLAQVFAKNNATLYIVGGFVRNAILGFCETDIDVCSRLLPDEIEHILPAKKYAVKLINAKLGTVHITVKSTGQEYEHTTFRAEVYNAGGNHSPESVRFVDDMALDASRRDFTANAIYYDILGGEFVDYYNGVTDVKAHILRTVETPEYVFSRDGLRILRLVRIANELNFTVDEHTFAVARKMTGQLADISQERFNKEIVAVLFADYKYDSIENPAAYLNGLRQIGELNAWEFVLPEFTELVGVENVRKLYSNTWQNLINSAQPVLRIPAFVADICAYLKLPITKELINSILGVGGIMLNKRECDRQFRVLFAFFEILKGDIFSEERARVFIQDISAYSTQVFGLCDLAHIGQKLQKTYTLMQIDKVPFNLKQLKINGNDIEAAYPEIPKREYAQILSCLLHRCAIMPELNRNDLLLKETATIYRELQNIH